jgi:hypothetical protein
MNYINTLFLKLALLPAPLYRRMGVHLPQLQSILHTKLIMDDRRPNTIMQTSQQKNNRPVSMATLGTMFFSGIMGLVFLFAFAIGNDIITHLTFFCSMFFFLLSATLIADFSSVLIDTRDNFIILPKPVNDRTFMLARLLHIFIHICKIIFPMALPAIVYLAINYNGWGAILLLFIVFLITLFAIFFINAVYILALQLTSPQRFKSVINYFQIVFAVLIFAGYQVFPRLIGDYNIDELSFSTSKNILYYPLYWFAACWKVLYSMRGNTHQWIAAAMGLLLPVISILVVIRYLAPAFNKKLALIYGSTTSDAPAKKVKGVASTSPGGYNHRVSRIITTTAAERMGFLFAWKLMARSREFKLKVYPGIGYLLVYAFIMFYGKDVSMTDFTEESRRGKIIVITGLYFSCIILNMAIGQMVFSEKYKAAWLFYTTPLKTPGDILLGGIKAALMQFYFPFAAFILFFGVALAGFRIVPNILLGVANVLLIASLLVYAGHRFFPFSMAQSNQEKTGSFLRNLMILIVAGVMALGHMLVYSFLPVVALLALLSFTAVWFLMRSIRHTTWLSIRSRYSDA